MALEEALNARYHELKQDIPQPPKYEIKPSGDLYENELILKRRLSYLLNRKLCYLLFSFYLYLY